MDSLFSGRRGAADQRTLIYYDPFGQLEVSTLDCENLNKSDLSVSMNLIWLVQSVDFVVNSSVYKKRIVPGKNSFMEELYAKDTPVKLEI